MDNNQMALETKIDAKLVTSLKPNAEQQAALNEINIVIEQICDDLQPVFRSLIITMLDLHNKQKGSKQ